MEGRDKKIDFNLYLITDRKQTLRKGQGSGVNGQGRLIDVVEDALKGGVKAVQLREKDLSGRELFELARDLRKLTRRYNTKLFINDRVDIAMAVNADGVHLGQTSFSPEDVRKILRITPDRNIRGQAHNAHALRLFIGVSTHSLKEALKAEKQGADLITFGPVFYTKSKAKYGKPLGIEKLQEVVQKIKIPIFAIGGIKLKNVKEVMSAGVHGVSMISEIMGAEKPKEAAEKLLEAV